MNIKGAIGVTGSVIFAAYIVGHLVPGRRAAVVAGALFVLLAVALVSFTVEIASSRARSSPFERMLLQAKLSPDRPLDLVRLERSAGWSAYQIDDFDSRLRPVLGRIVRHRLLDHHHIDADADPARAIDALGPSLAWILNGESPPITGVVRSSDILTFIERIEEA